MNSLFKDKNVIYTHNKQSDLRKDKIKILNNYLLFNEILGDSDINIITDSRLNKFDLRDLTNQVKNTHKIFSTEDEKKRGGVTILIKKEAKIRIKFFNSFKSENDGPRAIFIKAETEDNNSLGIAGLYVSPSNKTASFKEIEQFITSSFCIAKVDFKIVCGGFNIDPQRDEKNQKKKQ